MQPRYIRIAFSSTKLFHTVLISPGLTQEKLPEDQAHSCLKASNPVEVPVSGISVQSWSCEVQIGKVLEDESRMSQVQFPASPWRTQENLPAYQTSLAHTHTTKSNAAKIPEPGISVQFR